MDFSSIRKAQEALNQIKKFEDRFGNIHNLNKTLNDYHKHLNFPQISSLFLERQIEMQRVVDEMQQRNRAMTTIADSLSVFRGVKERLSEISNSYLSTNLSSSLANINKLAQEHLHIVNETKTLSSQYNVFNPVIKSAMFAGSLRLGEIEALRNNTVNFLPNEQFRGFLSEFQKSINDSRFFENIDVIRNSYFGNLAQTFRDVIESSESEEEAMEKMTSLVEEKLTESSNNTLLTQDTLKTVIALLGLIATLYFGFSNLANSKQSSETQQLRYNQLLKAIEKIVENTNPTNDEIEVYYAVEREFDARTKPDFKSIKFSRLYPNTKVKLIVEKHKWVYIEWTDYLEAVPRYGWVNKKYLKKLN
jgi:hypothetical protein